MAKDLFTAHVEDMVVILLLGTAAWRRLRAAKGNTALIGSGRRFSHSLS